MGREKKPVHRVQMTERKRNIIHQLLEEYNIQSKELQEKINEIPKEKKIEPDIQIVAPALEASKYCVEKEELRKMFVNLIASSF